LIELERFSAMKSKSKKPERRLLIPRKRAARLISRSVDTCKRLERDGRLTPIRLTGPQGGVMYRLDEVEALADV
jgi:hypothetical protein